MRPVNRLEAPHVSGVRLRGAPCKALTLGRIDSPNQERPPHEGPPHPNSRRAVHTVRKHWQ